MVCSSLPFPQCLYAANPSSGDSLYFLCRRRRPPPPPSSPVVYLPPPVTHVNPNLLASSFAPPPVHTRYESLEEVKKSLRYGHVMIMADQDHDGSHIKGLIINLFHTFWPALLKHEGFVQQFVSPIMKVAQHGERGRRRVGWW